MLITGATGMLGKSLIKFFPNVEILKGKNDLDLTDLKKVKEYFANKHHDIIIHCAAFTNIGYCDNNPTLANILHCDVVDILSKHCDKLIYISTNPYKYDTIYHLTKYQGELKTLINNPNNLVIRTNIVGKGGLVDWAVTNLQNNNQINGFSNSLFNAIHVDQLSNIIKTRLLNTSGIISVAGNYTMSKYDFLYYLSILLNLPTENITPCLLPETQDLIIKDIDIQCNFSEMLDFLKNDYYI